MSKPFVSIVTIAYNCEAYLPECIKSVLAQTYSNWEYIIVNNCSKDRTLEIAEHWATQDPRIRVQNNEKFVSAIENHNIGFMSISPQSKYCKFVYADDWIFPECLDAMVEVGEEHPSVGIVGAYGLNGEYVLWDGLRYPARFVPGREVCRMTLLGGPYVFGTATSLLFRSDIVRSRPRFYDEKNLHADYAACLESLSNCDFGFVYKILSYSRTRKDSLSSFAKDFNSIALGSMAALVKYGHLYLTPEEFQTRMEMRTLGYYQFLAKSALQLREREFWGYHAEGLEIMGLKLNRWRLFKAVCFEILKTVLCPLRAISGIRELLPRLFGPSDSQARETLAESVRSSDTR